jgi:hypothetical protein
MRWVRKSSLILKQVSNIKQGRHVDVATHVPWNNNNAEHAIRRFAKHRRHANGMFSENTLQEYLVMATIFETREFNNVNVLQFLLSKVNTLDGLFKMAGRRSRGSVAMPAEVQVVFDTANS